MIWIVYLIHIISIRDLNSQTLNVPLMFVLGSVFFTGKDAIKYPKTNHVRCGVFELYMWCAYGRKLRTRTRRERII